MQEVIREEEREIREKTNERARGRLNKVEREKEREREQMERGAKAEER